MYSKSGVTNTSTVQPGTKYLRGWRGMLRDRRSIVALEFAIVALPMVTLVLGSMEVSYDLFVQAVLDGAVQTAGRSVQVGTLQGIAGETSTNFATNALCPNVTPLLSCSLLVVAVTPVPAGYDYFSATPPSFATANTGKICTGTGGQLMLLQTWYLGPTIVGSLIPAFSQSNSGALTHITLSSTGFVNEAFTGGQTTGSGC